LESYYLRYRIGVMIKCGCTERRERALAIFANAGQFTHRPVFKEFLFLTLRNVLESGRGSMLNFVMSDEL
jgi:hypothetical protein